MDSLFFIASKVFWVLVQPLSLIGLLMAVCILAAVAGWRRLSLISSLFALLVLWLGAFTTLGELAMADLERRYTVAPELPAGPVSAILVLGGGLDPGAAKGPSGFELGPGGDRMIEAFILARRHPEAAIVVTGGDGTLSGGKWGDGALAPTVYEALGLSPDRLLTETQSRSTAEHPDLVRPILRARLETNPGTVLLVTSAFHMPRAKAVFDKAGFETTAWPVDFRARQDPPLNLLTGSPIDSMDLASTAIREWIGIMAYRLTGRI